MPQVVTGQYVEELARSLPSVAEAPGVAPWEPLVFLQWLCGPAPGSGATYAGRLLLSLWNRTLDWGDVARAEGLGDCSGVLKPFRLHDALSAWDAAHVAALAEWLGVPGVVWLSPLNTHEAELREAHGEEVISVQDPGGNYSGPAWLVEGWRQEAAHQEEVSRRWPADRAVALAVLGRSFPSLAVAPGLTPWRHRVFLSWLAHPSREPAALCAGRFVLDVWNSREDWPEAAREAGAHTPALASRFCLLEAVDAWDDAHRRAAVAFMAAPFWP